MPTPNVDRPETWPLEAHAEFEFHIREASDLRGKYETLGSGDIRWLDRGARHRWGLHVGDPNITGPGDSPGVMGPGDSPGVMGPGDYPVVPAEDYPNV